MESAWIPVVSKYSRFKRKDANHKEIIAYFRSHGALVDDVSDLMGLGYDIVVGWGEVIVLVEIKDGDKPPSARRLTESEEAAQARWGQKFAVIESTDQARVLLGNMCATDLQA